MNPSTSKFSLFSTVLAFLLCIFSAHGSALQVDWVEIESSGVGVTAKAARKAAILSALRKYAGEYMAEEQIVDKGELTNSVLLSFTTQKSFETEDLEGYPQIDDSGNWVVMMKVRLVEREYQEMINYLHPKQYSGSITVQATGTAPSVPEAERIAIANGVRMIVGEHVASELKIENDLLLIDVVKSFTRSSNVKSKRVGRPEVEGENVKVTMSVTAELEPLFTMCRDGMTSATAIRGDVLAAEISLVRDNQKAQIRLLQSLLKDLPTKLLVARLIDREGNPITDGRPDNEDIRPIVGTLAKSAVDAGIVNSANSKRIAIAFNVELSINWDIYFKQVVPTLDKVLSALCTSRTESSFVLRLDEHKTPIQISSFGASVDPSNWIFDSAGKCVIYLVSKVSETEPGKVVRGYRYRDSKKISYVRYELNPYMFQAFSDIGGDSSLYCLEKRSKLILENATYPMINILGRGHAGEYLFNLSTSTLNCLDTAGGLKNGTNGEKGDTFGYLLPVRSFVHTTSIFNTRWHVSDVDHLLISPFFHNFVLGSVQSGSPIKKDAREISRLGNFQIYRSELLRIETALDEELLERLIDLQITGSLHRQSYEIRGEYNYNLSSGGPINPGTKPISLDWKDSNGLPITRLMHSPRDAPQEEKKSKSNPSRKRRLGL